MADQAETPRMALNSLNNDLVNNAISAGFSIRDNGGNVNVYLTNPAAPNAAKVKDLVKQALQDAIAAL